MGALQKVIAQVLTRLRDTNLSQRVALFLGGTLVAVSLFWLAHWAATPEMVPLLEQDWQPEDLTLGIGDCTSLRPEFIEELTTLR